MNRLWDRLALAAWEARCILAVLTRHPDSRPYR